MEKNVEKLFESLSPNERKILPHIEEKSLIEICKRSNLDKVSVMRALEYLKKKGLVKISIKKKKIIDIDINGALYRKKNLPERRLLNLLNEKHIIAMQEAKKEAGLSDDEFKASIGILRRKKFIEIKNKKIILSVGKEEIAKKTEEESLLESLPIEEKNLSKEQKGTLKNLEKRKNIILTKDKKEVDIEVTDLGKKISRESGSIFGENNLIEQITPELIKNNSSWKRKKFRRYDINLPVPEIYGGKRHFVNQAADYGRKIWLEMGFKEMSGPLIQSSFWNFDALFTPQDHPAREMQDTFFLDGVQEDLDAEKNVIESVKLVHEIGLKDKEKSKGWQYKWNEKEASKPVLRTHTTCLSAKTLASLKEKNIPIKFFAIGKVFRNETIDWSHSFEFNQTEGIVVDKNANFRHLLGYLKQFFEKMGFEKIRFRPFYFPYTEPSVEIDVWHPEKKTWLELGGAGIFRPEVVVPLLGKNIPVLAWGPGFDRIIMDYYEIKDLREIYKNNLTQLRKMKFWLK